MKRIAGYGVMKTIKGPGIFLAQFAGDAAPFNTLEGMADWAAELEFAGIQIPSWDRRLFDLERAAESQAYCDDVRGVAAKVGLEITELSTHLQGQLVASHPAFDTLLDGFAPAQLAGDAKARAAWGAEQLKRAAKASRNLGLSAHATFSGALAWPFSIPGRNDRLDSSMRHSRNWRGAGRRFWMRSMRPAWMFASSCIPAKTCTMG